VTDQAKLDRALALAIEEANKVEVQTAAARLRRASAPSPELEPGELPGNLAQAWRDGFERLRACPDLSLEHVDMAFAVFVVSAESIDQVLTTRVWSTMASCEQLDGYDPDEDPDGQVVAAHVFQMLLGYGMEMLLAGMFYQQGREDRP
jgi:hypothetical protein